MDDIFYFSVLRTLVLQQLNVQWFRATDPELWRFTKLSGMLALSSLLYLAGGLLIFPTYHHSLQKFLYRQSLGEENL